MIEIQTTSDECETTVVNMLKREGYEPHPFVTKYGKVSTLTKKTDTYCEQIWEKPDVQILVLRVTWGGKV